MMRQKDYTTVNTLIDVYSEDLLTPEDFEFLLNATTTSSIMDVLADTKYRMEEHHLNDGVKIDRVLMDRLIQTYRFAYTESPIPEIVDIFGARYMYHNLKVMLKDIILDVDHEYLRIPIGRFDFDTLQHIAQTRESTRLPQQMIDLINDVHHEAEDYQSSEAIDIGFDMAYFDHIKAVSKEYGSGDTDAIVQAIIEFYNITTLIRAKRQQQTRSFMIEAYTSQGLFTLDEYLEILEENDYHRWYNTFTQLPYNGEINAAIERLVAGELSIGELEKLKDVYIEGLFREKRFSNTLGLNMLSYINAREMEVTNLRLILVGRVNSLSREQIEERMRPVYGN